MAENPGFASIDGTGLHVELQRQWHSATLRYFERDGAFTRMVKTITRLSVPGALGAAQIVGGEVILLAWCSPTQTTLLSSAAQPLEALQTAAHSCADGCLIDQRGGLLVIAARGEAVAGLVARRAGHGALPGVGESRRARFAEVSVQIVKVRAEETLFIVDRIYAPHVMDSIRATAVDL